MEQLVADNGSVLARFTVADCASAPVLWRWLRLPQSFESRPKVARLRYTATARPGFTQMGPVA